MDRKATIWRNKNKHGRKINKFNNIKKEKWIMY